MFTPIYLTLLDYLGCLLSINISKMGTHFISSHEGNCSDLLTCPPASALAYTAARVIPRKWKSDPVTSLPKNPPVPPHSPQSKRQKTLQ